MAFRAQDLRKTVRRERGSALRRLYPRLLRDDDVLPKLGIAIRFFETKLGLARRELDGEALTQLFGDPKLARGIVACLARSYRYRERAFDEVIGAARAATLRDRGLATPQELRALAYARANGQGGFVAPTERAAFLASLVPELAPADLEQLLWLDAGDRAILTRVGPVPEARDVLAHYNLQAFETLARNARELRLSIRGDWNAVRSACARHGVEVARAGATATLRGRQDALGSWTRHGGHLARAALTLLGSGELGPGEAEVVLGDETYLVRLDAELLATALPERRWYAPASTWPAVEGFVAELLAGRRAGRLAGWRLWRWPDPSVTAQAVVWPEFSVTRGTTTLALLPLTTRQIRDGAAALAALAERLPVIVLVDGPAGELPAGLTAFPLAAGGAAALAGYLEATFPTGTTEATPAWLAALAGAARAAGSLAESDLAHRLDCAEELVGERLAALDVPDLVYVEGFGLCAESFLEQARALLAVERARNDGRLDLGLLGRKLRVLAGRNEGLHALIAYLAGDLRLAA